MGLVETELAIELAQRYETLPNHGMPWNWKLRAAWATEESENGKTGRVSITYASQVSCSPTCPYRGGGGCYAEHGHMAMSTRRANMGAGLAAATYMDVAREEAADIRTLTGRLPLRIHAVGDCRDNAAARLVAAAAVEHMAKHGQAAWGYTHSWREVDRASWGKVSMLASVETREDARRAMGEGWAAAIVMTTLPTDGRAWREGDIGFIPCPAQLSGRGRDKTCVTCKLCWDDSRLLARRNVVVFTPDHGTDKRITIALTVVNAQGGAA